MLLQSWPGDLVLYIAGNLLSQALAFMDRLSPYTVAFSWRLGSGMAAKGYFWKIHEPYIDEHGILLIVLEAFLVER